MEPNVFGHIEAIDLRPDPRHIDGCNRVWLCQSGCDYHDIGRVRHHARDGLLLHYVREETHVGNGLVLCVAWIVHGPGGWTQAISSAKRVGPGAPRRIDYFDGWFYDRYLLLVVGFASLEELTGRVQIQVRVGYKYNIRALWYYKIVSL